MKITLSPVLRTFSRRTTVRSHCPYSAGVESVKIVAPVLRRGELSHAGVTHGKRLYAGSLFSSILSINEEYS